jgi:hypothetical protein
LGNESHLFCNRVAPTWNRLHYQIIASGNMTVWESKQDNWPALTVRTQGENVTRMCDSVCSQINGLLSHNRECDLALRWVTDHFESIMLPRDRGKTRPKGILGNEVDFGCFGALEMAGYFVTGRTERAHHILADPDWPIYYERALRELSRL